VNTHTVLLGMHLGHWFPIPVLICGCVWGGVGGDIYRSEALLDCLPVTQSDWNIYPYEALGLFPPHAERLEHSEERVGCRGAWGGSTPVYGSGRGDQGTEGAHNNSRDF
jgi:hypothetical protein